MEVSLAPPTDLPRSALRPSTVPARADRFYRSAIMIPVLAALSGCANPAADAAAWAQQALVGMPKQTLLSCAGVPDRTAAIDNIEYFTYTSGHTEYQPGPRFGFYSGFSERRSAFGLGLGLPLDPYDVGTVESVTCDATFTLRNGRVERLVYGGYPGGDWRLNQCYAIVENCLALIPRPSQLSPQPQNLPAQ